MNFRTRMIALSMLVVLPSWVWGQVELWPQFEVPGAEREMELLNRLHEAHHERAFSTCTLWDRWLPHATLWASESKRQKVRQSLQSRRIDDEGYVAMQQHRGMAHSDGWPFPAWQQSTGIGFHFSVDRELWAVQHFRLKPLESWDDWGIVGAEVDGIEPQLGLQLRSNADQVQITTPSFQCGTIVAPFVRIEWALSGQSQEAEYRLEWLLEGESDWPQERFLTGRVANQEAGMHYLNLPLYRQTGYQGIVTRYRLTLFQAKGMRIDFKSLITAIDTRHPITNFNYLRGCIDYFCWTGDIPFLTENIERMRHALRFALQEFRVREGGHVLVPWVGHDGRSGILIDEAGNKTLRPGLGVGNNYWDLLPFGGHDGLATIYLYDALLRMADLEAAIETHPAWQVSVANGNQSAVNLRELAERVQADYQTRFWNPQTERFVGWIDTEGTAYDYGLTFVNLEAIAYGLASEHQAEKIFAWLDGRRIVDGDTSVGEDIYHWRFAPRATTRRNIESYVWAWSAPETIPWGGQVQDGGAVLGFSYHDLLARIKVLGPDNACDRLKAILDWFADVEAAGGYRAYYADSSRGTLQGGGTAGGLGLDQEFLESVLIPQIMLYGFLGFEPTPDGYRLSPQLPKDWKSLTIRNIQHQHSPLAITAYADGRVEIDEVANMQESVQEIWIFVGPSEHPPGTHEVPATARLLKHILMNQLAAKVEVKIIETVDEAMAERDDVATIICLGDFFPATRMENGAQIQDRLRRLMDRGCGMLCLHFATGLAQKDVAADGHHPLLEWIGGYFATACEHHQSIAKIMQATIEPSEVEHPVLRGWQAFEFFDEPYYNNYFGPHGPDSRLQVLATAQIPPENPHREIVAWGIERSDGGRGSGIVMPHFFRSWRNNNFRKLVVNAALWTGGFEIPEVGVETELLDLEAFGPAAIE
ncbi:MAG TPA: ThuA domain-containing protein [Pirellulaceae bacterium]|nr:ThuA domain-containing protein [Pirellulaceae bacterium]